MRHESSVTSVSWIPSEAVDRALLRAPFDIGVMHYDEPPPDRLSDLESLRKADRFRFANRLHAWIEVNGGTVTAAGYSGGGVIGSTTVRLARRRVVFPAVALPDIQKVPEIQDGQVRFVQTTGGRTGLPGPRLVPHAPFAQWVPPTVWTTLALTLGIDGSSEPELIGASPFPRHWLFDANGQLMAKAGLADFTEWWRHAFGRHTPWGDEDSPVILVPAETELERRLSTLIMRGGAKPVVKTIEAGDLLTRQGEPGAEVFLVLDGILGVEVDGEQIAQVGPGAIVGERALLEAGRRTASLRCLTRARVAIARGDQLDPSKLSQVSEGHRRERRDYG